jgi:hypothetical protein
MKTLPTTILSGLFSLVAFSSMASETLDLSGEWKLALDPNDAGLAAGPATWNFPDTIQLPGTLTLAGKGNPLTRQPTLDKQTLQELHQRHSYIGPAWYQREVEIPAGWADKDIILELERVIWQSRLWINGSEAGVGDSLSTPHRFVLSNKINPGSNTLTLRIDNREQLPIGIGHAYTNATQTIWNGVVGKFVLTAVPKARIDHLRLRSDGNRIAATLTLHNSSEAPVSANIAIHVAHPDGRKMPPVTLKQNLPPGDSTREIDIPLGASPAFWSEFTPTLYQVDATLESPSGISSLTESYGHRSFTADGRKLLVNGRQTFLRGTLECAIFPKTGHPDMTGNEWEKIFTTLKAHGLNHLRFHSWCPPRAAFKAADKHGIYLQVELPNWSFHMGQRPPVDDYFRAEGERIFREFGNHPSFVLFCLGNELTGDYNAMDRLVKHFREMDPDKLFTSTAFSFSPRGKAPGPEDDFFISQETNSGWVRGQGFINQTPPNTISDYSEGLSSIKIPLVTHEVGQYNNYPNLAELPKYEGGALRALGYEAIRDDLERRGRLEDAPRLTRDSGKLAALLYKEDMERALRTPDQAGIQLLDLHDFPGQSTATVGLLDSFWDSKGFISPEKFREFAGPVVPLARMGKFVWENSETFVADLELANFSQGPLTTSFTAQLLGADGVPVASHTFASATYPLGNGQKIGRLEVPLDRFATATRLDLVVASEDGAWKNSWPVWFFPAGPAPVPPAGLLVLDSPGPALRDALAAGRSVLLLPSRGAISAPIDARFIPVFWSPLHFPDQPGTLGASIESDHPVFSGFPTDTFTNWQWWELFSTSFAMDLDGLESKPEMPLRFVDKYNRNALPAAIWQAKVGPGKLLVCTLDIESQPAKRIAARQLRASILAYMATGNFNPTVSIDPASLQSMFKEVRFPATAETSDPSHPATAAVDGDSSTFWHTEWKSGLQRLPASLTVDLGAGTETIGFDYAPRADSDRGRVKRYRVEASDNGNQWRLISAESELGDSPDSRRVDFSKPVKARFLRLVVISDHGRSGHAAVATFEPVRSTAGDARRLGIVPGFNDGRQD